MTTKKDNVMLYTHSRITDDVVFYVGIGARGRPWSVYARNPHWHRTVAKHGYMVNILQSGLSWGDACKKEKQLIAEYRTVSGKVLTNLTEGGEGAYGLIHSDATRNKLRESAKYRKPVSQATRDKLRKCFSAVSLKNLLDCHARNKGKKLPDEVRAKISLAQKGRVTTDETKAKLRAANLGKAHSPSVKAKISESHKKLEFTAERKAQLDAARAARPPVSEETREKLRISHLAYYAKRRDENKSLTLTEEQKARKRASTLRNREKAKGVT